MSDWRCGHCRRGLSDRDRVRLRSGQLKQLPRFFLRNAQSKTRKGKRRPTFLVGLKQHQLAAKSVQQKSGSSSLKLPPPSFVGLEQVHLLFSDESQNHRPRPSGLNMHLCQCLFCKPES